MNIKVRWLLRSLALLWSILFIVIVVLADAQGWRNEPALMFFIFSPAIASLATVVASVRKGEGLGKAAAVASGIYMAVLGFGGAILGFYFLLPASILMLASVIGRNRTNSA